MIHRVLRSKHGRTQFSGIRVWLIHGHLRRIVFHDDDDDIWLLFYCIACILVYLFIYLFCWCLVVLLIYIYIYIWLYIYTDMCYVMFW